MDIDPWEEHYRSGATLWRGSPYPLPELEIGSRVLDLGCGTGSTVIKAAEKGHEVTGLDISPSALEIASGRISERGLKAELIEMDITEPVIDMEKYDLVLSHYVLGALDREGRERASKNIGKWLKEGGLLSFEDLAVDDIRDGKGKEIEDGTFRKGSGIIQHFFTLEELEVTFSDLDTVEMKIEEWKHGSMERRRIRGLFRHP
jgi:SAM-dependent methyltransferase